MVNVIMMTMIMMITHTHTFYLITAIKLAIRQLFTAC